MDGKSVKWGAIVGFQQQETEIRGRNNDEHVLMMNTSRPYKPALIWKFS